jgi:signal transduction histidine kinase
MDGMSKSTATSRGKEDPWSSVVLRRLVVLGLVLVLTSAVIIVVPSLAIAWYHPLFAIVIAALAGVVGLAVLQLGLWRFLILGRPLDACVGLAFGVLASTNLVVQVIIPIAGVTPPVARVSLTLLLMGRLLAAGLLLVGLYREDQLIESGKRTRFALGLSGGVGLILALGSIGLVFAGPALPAVLDEGARQLLASRAPVVDALSGQRPWLLVVNLALGLASLVTSAGYIRVAVRSGEAYFDALAAALLVLTCAQLHTLLFPPVAIGYVSTAALLRLVAYLILLFGLVMALRVEVGMRAAQEERLRLSRDLHDGLVQQLGLLRLRLGQASTPDRPAVAVAQALAVAEQVLDVAMLEARQVLVALRSGTVTWAEFAGALRHVGGTFGANHELAVAVHIAETGPDLAAELQADALRIVHEMCSNALRHGAAQQIDIAAELVTGALELRIHDDGCGFEPAAVAGGPGLGLRSIGERAEARGGGVVIQSALGRGTTIRVWFALMGRRA